MANLAVFTPVESAAQIAAAAALAGQIWPECYAQILTPAQIEYMVSGLQSAEAIARQIHEEGYEYFLVYPEGGASVKAGNAMEWDKPPGAAGYIGVQEKDGKLLLSKLYLLAATRGAGLGRQALQFVETLARQKHCRCVWLTVNRNNHRALAVYQRAGFKILRQQDANIGGGFLMEDFVLEKPLL